MCINRHKYLELKITHRQKTVDYIIISFLEEYQKIKTFVNLTRVVD